MAGGEGSRLRPLTCSIPKPMVPILNKPVMEHTIELLKRHNIKDIAVTLWYLPGEITDYFGDGSDFGVNLHYYVENTPLGTGGSVLNTAEFLDDTFIVISGDALTDINLQEAIKFHRDRGSRATLVLKRVPVPLEYGIVITKEDGRIVKFLEKPSWGEVFSDTINTGIYVLDKSVMSYYTRGENFDFSKDLFPRLLRDNIPLYGYVSDGYWCDVGDLTSYKETHYDILSGKVQLSTGYMEESDIITGKNTIISAGAVLNPPIFIGEDCIIKAGAIIDAYSVIGNGCIVEENTTIKRSILWDRVSLGRVNQLRSTILCNRVSVKDRANLYEDSIVGYGCTIGDNSTLKPGVKVWPNKKISEASIVNNNLIWGNRTSRALFGNRGISGQFNIDITPEFSSLLGSAFVSSLGKEPTVIIGSEDGPQAKLLKEAVISGCLSSGARVIDIKEGLIPQTRYGVRAYNATGGIHISYSNNIAALELINSRGGNIDRKMEKKVEGLFLREDFERCSPEGVSTTVCIDSFRELYLKHALEGIRNLEKLKSRGYKVLISSPSQLTLRLAADFLNRLCCRVTMEYVSSGEVEDYFSFGDMVQKNNFDIGLIISENGENLILIDEMGTPVDRNKYPVLSSLISLKWGLAESLIVPYTASEAIEKLAKGYNAKVVRAKSSFSELINTVLQNDKLADLSELQYILNFDGIYAAGKLLDFMIEGSTTLHSLSRELPPIHIIKKEFPCSLQDRGSIIRQLVEEGKDLGIELFDGIKYSTDRGWSLILPDNSGSVFNVYSEGNSEEYAKELSTEALDRLRAIVGKGKNRKLM